MQQTQRTRPSPARPQYRINRGDEPVEAPAKEVPAPKSSSEWALGIVLVVFGTIGWLIGNKYTLNGWIVGLNIGLEWLDTPTRIPAFVGWPAVIVGAALGAVYSRVETRIWHRRSRLLMRAPLFWIGWLIIVLSDVGSTYLGVRSVSATSWQITQQVAALVPAAALWSALLTFIPEWMILGGIKFLRW